MATNDTQPHEPALRPVEERVIEFYEDNLTAVAVEVEGQRKIFVPIKPISEYLGVDWSSQRQRVMRDEILAEAVRGVVITTTPSASGGGGGPQVMLCLPIEMMHGWLFGLQAARVRPELRDKVLRYQRDCYRVLFEAFQAKAIESAEAVADPIMSPVQTEPSAQILQIREMGLN